MKRWIAALLCVGWCVVALSAWVDGPLTPLMNLRGRTDENGYLRVSGGTPGAVDGPLTPLGNLRGRTDENGYLRVAIGSGGALFSDGTAPLPSIAFASEPTLGFWRSSAANVTLAGGSFTTAGAITSGTDITLASGRFIRWTAKSHISSATDGLISVGNFGATIGSMIKADALPTVSACGAGSPAVIAGSTPLSGGVTVGTGGPITCAITFNGTAYPSAPHCSGAVETVTAANARAMGYSATTTVLTIVPATAWADGSVVNWNCISAK